MSLIQAGPPSWEFEVSGRLIERAESEGTAPAPITPAPLPGSAAALSGQPVISGPRFSTLIRRLTIRLDPKQYPDDGVITWSKALHEGPAKEKFSVRSASSPSVPPKRNKTILSSEAASSHTVRTPCSVLRSTDARETVYTETQVKDQQDLSALGAIYMQRG